MLDPSNLPISYDQARGIVRDSAGIICAYATREDDRRGLEDFAAELHALADDLLATAKSRNFTRPDSAPIMAAAEAWLGRAVPAWHEAARPKGSARATPKA